MRLPWVPTRAAPGATEPGGFNRVTLDGAPVGSEPFRVVLERPVFEVDVLGGTLRSVACAVVAVELPVFKAVRQGGVPTLVKHVSRVVRQAPLCYSPAATALGRRASTRRVGAAVEH